MPDPGVELSSRKNPWIFPKPQAEAGNFQRFSARMGSALRRRTPRGRHFREHFRGDTDCCEACGNIADNQGIRGDHCAIANGHRANNAGVATDVDMIAYRSSTWSRSCANGAHMMKCAIGTDLGGVVHSDRTAMRDNQTWSDLGIGVKVDKCQHHEQLPYDAEHPPYGCPKPSGSTLPNRLLKPMDNQGPEALGPPAGEAVIPETRQVRSARSPLAIPCPCLDYISVIPHRVKSHCPVRDLARQIIVRHSRNSAFQFPGRQACRRGRQPLTGTADHAL